MVNSNGIKFTDEQYIEANDSMYENGEADVRCQTVKVTKTRKDHVCMCPGIGVGETGHVIPSGSRAVVDRALVDGAWGACYTCLPCLEAWKLHCDDPDNPFCGICDPEEIKSTRDLTAGSR